MAENSHISWTDHTFNPWIGCTNVGPGCDHCYAEKLATTRLKVGWGTGAPRRRTKPGNWAKPRKWNREADSWKAEHGHYPRVFAASLADIFDNEVDEAWRADFWALVKETPKLQWLIVTKRIGNVAKMLPADWGNGYQNVVLLITVVNQAEADRDIPKLMKTPARLRGLSIEPMLGSVDIKRWLYPVHPWWPSKYRSWQEAEADGAKVEWKPQGLVLAGARFIDWVITGGESKQLEGKRPLVELEAQWIRDVDLQCTRSATPHHFKQWGHTIPVNQIDIVPREEPGPNRITYIDETQKRAVFHESMGRQLDGLERNHFPDQRDMAA